MLKRLSFGVVVWAVPYVTAIPLMPLMKSDPVFFKTIMIVEGALVGALLSAAYFLRIEKAFLREGILLAAVWIATSWVLDYFALLPFSKMPLERYFIEVGARYLAIVAPTVTVGYVLEKRLGGRD
jgi:uncharacterized membrane protein YpjA